MMNKLLPFERGYNRDPNIKAFERTGFINHGSTSGFRVFGVGLYTSYLGYDGHGESTGHENHT